MFILLLNFNGSCRNVLRLFLSILGFEMHFCWLTLYLLFVFLSSPIGYILPLQTNAATKRRNEYTHELYYSLFVPVVQEFLRGAR